MLGWPYLWDLASNWHRAWPIFIDWARPKLNYAASPRLDYGAWPHLNYGPGPMSHIGLDTSVGTKFFVVAILVYFI